MTDEADVDANDDIARLLADARVTDPLPGDVADRLDATLADLVVSRETRVTASRTPSNVIPLRRRVLPRVLVAAAAIVVVTGAAIAAPHIHERNTGQNSGAASADSAGSGSQSGAVPRSLPATKGLKAQSQHAAEGTMPMAIAGSLVQLTSDHFRADVRKLVRTLDASARTAYGAVGVPTASAAPTVPTVPSPTDDGLAGSGGSLTDTVKAPDCPTPTGLDPGAEVIAVTVDGAPAVLVVHPMKDGSRLAQAFSCDAGAADATPLASATVPR
jgi:hypothetical protein